MIHSLDTANDAEKIKKIGDCTKNSGFAETVANNVYSAWLLRVLIIIHALMYIQVLQLCIAKVIRLHSLFISFFPF